MRALHEGSVLRLRTDEAQENTRPDSVCVWQDKEDAAPEAAIIIAAIDDNLIEIQQEGRWVIINAESLEKIIKVLRQVNKNRN